MSERFYGLYRGVVTDDADPLGVMRVRVSLPSVLGATTSPWAMPCLPPGVIGVPSAGSGVWVQFEEGDLARPVWMGAVGPPARAGDGQP
jgi:hypothetical protein